jgi:AraC family L-rhamnose operon transcriptional activator RhaR
MKTLHWSAYGSDTIKFHVTRASPGNENTPDFHKHDFYELFYVTAGPGLHWHGGCRTRLETGDLVSIRPEHAHGFQRIEGKPLHIVNFAFPAELVSSFLKRHRESLPGMGWESRQAAQIRRFSPSAGERASLLFEELSVCGRSKADAEWFLLSLFRLLSPPPGGWTQSGTLPHWLNTFLQGDSRADVIAGGLPVLFQKCGRAPEHVAREFRRHLAVSPSEWLLSARLHRACELLERTDQSITEVAFEAGFQNLGYFHRAFQRAHGQTPRQYRLLARSIAG